MAEVLDKGVSAAQDLFIQKTEVRNIITYRPYEYKANKGK